MAPWNKLSLACGLAVAAIGLAASTTSAAIFAKGAFNNWGDTHEMTEVAPGSGHFTVTATGLAAGSTTEFKINDTTANTWLPGSNGKVAVDGSGEITFHYHVGTFADGWQPASNRVGYDDPGHGWDVMGSFNGWSAPLDMTTTGAGVYTATLTVPAPGTFAFKFRKDDDWGIAIGDDFGNSAADNSFTTTAANEQVQFLLDLPGGRWDAVSVVPEPASVGLLGVAAVGLLRRRRIV